MNLHWNNCQLWPNWGCSLFKVSVLIWSDRIEIPFPLLWIKQLIPLPLVLWLTKRKESWNFHTPAPWANPLEQQLINRGVNSFFWNSSMSHETRRAPWPTPIVNIVGKVITIFSGFSFNHSITPSHFNCRNAIASQHFTLKIKIFVIIILNIVSVVIDTLTLPHTPSVSPALDAAAYLEWNSFLVFFFFFSLLLFWTN